MRTASEVKKQLDALESPAVVDVQFRAVGHGAVRLEDPIVTSSVIVKKGDSQNDIIRYAVQDLREDHPNCWFGFRQVTFA